MGIILSYIHTYHVVYLKHTILDVPCISVRKEKRNREGGKWIYKVNLFFSETELHDLKKKPKEEYEVK